MSHTANGAVDVSELIFLVLYWLRTTFNWPGVFTRRRNCTFMRPHMCSMGITSGFITGQGNFVMFSSLRLHVMDLAMWGRALLSCMMHLLTNHGDNGGGVWFLENLCSPLVDVLTQNPNVCVPLLLSRKRRICRHPSTRLKEKGYLNTTWRHCLTSMFLWRRVY